jgi:oligo-1,6-glucosidase
MQRPWWATSVVYQVYPRSFKDSDGDGVGDLRGILEKLDYLQALGVDVLWVSPFYRSPMVDNGYDISDYREVDPLFGTLGDVDELIEALHRRGMRLMIDVVLNHTSDEHPWFLASRSREEGPRRDWYWWRAARPGATPGTAGAEPTNWMSYFSEPAWTYDDDAGAYYLHLFARQQPDLNWENPEVRRALYAMLRWWRDRGVDGFRMDVINLVSKTLPLRDGDPVPGTRLGDGTPFVESGPRIHEYLQELHLEVLAGGDRELLTVGEMLGVTLEDARRFTDPARRELDMVFQFEHVTLDQDPDDRFVPRPLDLVALKRSLGRWQRGLARRGWNSLYWNNHDQPRAVSRFGSDDPAHRVRSAKLLGTLLHLHRGTPFVYQGEELGMTNVPLTSLDDLRDVDSLNYARLALGRGESEATVLARLRAKSRDNARSPMQWDAGPQAGFTRGRPWMPVNPNHGEINVAGQVDDPDSVWSHYRRLIRMRREVPAVAFGDFTMLLPEHPQVYAFTRRLDDVELLVLANVGSRDVQVEVPGAAGWAGAELLLSNYDGPVAGPALGPGVGALRPWEANVYRRVAESPAGRSGGDGRA